MSTTKRPGVKWAQGWVAAIASIVVALALSSCGGGGVGSGGTGSPQTSLGGGSYGSGTVTGFGSLIVDGVAYADAQVPVTIESQPGVQATATAKLGQFAELEFAEPTSGTEVLRAIRIEAAAVGRIDTLDTAGRVLTVLGQTILENSSADAGPVTFYFGVAGLHALRVGDAVEVHGVPRWNAAADRYEVLATRIEKLPADPPVQRLAGVVQNESASGTLRTFRLGGMQITYSASSTLPAGSTLRNGDHVLVWSDRPSSATLAASAVRVVARSLAAAGKDARLGGTVSRLDEVSQRFDLTGVVVRYGNAMITTDGKRSTLANGAYVVVEGTLAADGALDAKHVKIRKRDDDGDGDDDDDDDEDDDDKDDLDVKLTGPIENFVSVVSFSVRGTPVDALGARLQRCGSALLRNGLNVRVEGQVQTAASGSVVKAESVRCLN
jgi:Domain of unknown function (DUF5666)